MWQITLAHCVSVYPYAKQRRGRGFEWTYIYMLCDKKAKPGVLKKYSTVKKGCKSRDSIFSSKEYSSLSIKFSFVERIFGPVSLWSAGYINFLRTALLGTGWKEIYHHFYSEIEKKKLKSPKSKIRFWILGKDVKTVYFLYVSTFSILFLYLKVCCCYLIEKHEIWNSLKLL